MRNKILVILFVLTIAGMGVFTATRVVAEDATNGQNRMQSLVQIIAEKFGLKQADVQAVFDQDKTDRQAKREKDYLSRLDQLVIDKKITEAQKQLIILKNKELQDKRQAEFQSLQGKTAEERKTLMAKKRTEMQTERTELQTWATKNGIDIKYLMGGFGSGRGFGKEGGMMRGDRPW